MTQNSHDFLDYLGRLETETAPASKKEIDATCAAVLKKIGLKRRAAGTRKAGRILLVAAAVAVVIALNADHTGAFTAWTFAAWGIVTGVLIGGWAIRGVEDTMTRFYLGVVAGVTLLAGVMAPFWAAASPEPTARLIMVWAFVAGAVETLAALRMEAGEAMRSDHLIAGVLGLLLGLAESGAGQSVWGAGLRGFYLALVGVQQMIAGFGLRDERDRDDAGQRSEEAHG